MPSNTPRFVSRTLLPSSLFLALALAPNPAQSTMPAWRQPYKSTLNPAAKHFARNQLSLFRRFLDSSLRGDGKKVFLQVAGAVRNNVGWRNDLGRNAYNEAFRLSYPFVKTVELEGMPNIILLMPYLESQWNGHAGERARDYGYWQLGRYVVEEIQSLDYAPTELKKNHPDRIRSDASLSTKAAQIHLRRYWYYFAKVRNFPDSDAWLFAITAYNWGSGNVKRMIAEMESKGIAVNFSNFYHYLHAIQQRNPSDKSMKAAVEYLPNLWSIVQLIVATN
ncbi:MAG: transglycosylase SLT domain-containing protein [Gammaproteobacteria bacterium]|nr:transglycosylase SLT domain-containing protein [Gammaproteobacteria bacterium]MBU1655886.1 transglycosylase SLT domain-containing protein [Gammaproteobacteria bacterium]MBU1961017.1 transglycosylase SLT domain-containing protein [Gammaproteobacteria bacterium]